MKGFAAVPTPPPPGDDPYRPFRQALRRLFLSLAASRESCVRLHAALPVSLREAEMLAGRIPTDFPTEVRGTLECVLADSLTERLLASFLEAAEYGLEPADPPP